MSDYTDKDDTLPPDTTPPVDPPDADDAEIVVSLVRKEKEFKVNTKDGGTATYKLVELSGVERDKWMTEMSKRTKLDASGKATGISSADGIQASLLSMAIVTDRNERLAPPALQQWPASALNTLFMRAIKMNGLDKESVEEAKKA